MSIKKNIPNALTSFNLLAGVIGITLETKGYHDAAVMCMLAALVFDFLDGFVARLLKVSSEIGKQLDSLADMVTFGVLPAIMMFNYMSSTTCAPGNCEEIGTSLFPYLGFIIAVYSAIRLAKFNIDTDQTDSFKGLPTPANAALIAFLPDLGQKNLLIQHVMFNPQFLIILTFFLCWIMISDIRMIALKFKNFGFKGNEFRYLLIITALVELVALQTAAIPVIIITYMVLSIVQNFTKRESV